MCGVHRAGSENDIKKGLLDAVRICLIHNPLLLTPKIHVDLVVHAIRNAA